MKRLRALLGCTLALVLALSPTLALGQGYSPLSYKFWVQARDEYGNKIASGVTCQVYTAGTDTVPTIYSDTALSTTIGGAVITADSSGQCTWYSTAATAVDVYVWHKNGRGVVLALDPYTHSVVLHLNATQKIVRIPFNTKAAAQTATYVMTGYTIPKGTVVDDVVIQATGGQATIHLTVGTYDGGVANESTTGFCGGGANKVGDTNTTGMNIPFPGWFRCHAVLATLTGPTGVSNVDRYISAFHSGTYLSAGAIGSTNMALGVPHVGSYLRFPFLGDGVRKSVVYTTGDGTSVGTVGGAFIHGFFYLLERAPGLQN